MIDLLILNIPGTFGNKPMAAPAVLKAVANQQGFSAKTIDFNARYAHACKQNQELTALEPFWTDQTSSLDLYQQASKLVQTWVAELEPYQARYIGISVFTYQSRRAAEMFCAGIRQQLPSAKIILGGQGIPDGGINGSTEWLHKINNLDLIDHWVRSEGEQAVIEILSGQAGKMVDHLSNAQITNLDSIPWPDYSDYNFDLYESKILPITGSRGCIRSCSFCDIHTHWPKFTWRSGEQIANEMIGQSKRYGINSFQFTDSLVNGNQKEYRKMIGILAQYNQTVDLPIKWTGQFILRPASSNDDEYYRLTADSGAFDLAIGIESGSELVRQHIGKEFSNADIDHAMVLMAQYRITCGFLLIIGYPTETVEDFELTLDMIKRYSIYANTTLTEIEFGSTLAVLPGTPLEQMANSLGLQLDTTHENYWLASSNPTLDLKERLRRRFVARQTAESLGYKLGQDSHKEMLINMWTNYKSRPAQSVIKFVRQIEVHA